MEVAVLVILYDATEYITVHENESLGWSELVQFVDSRWRAVFAFPNLPKSLSEEDRVSQFFAKASGTYVLGTADVSAIARRVDVALGN